MTQIKDYVEVTIEKAKGYSGKMSRKGWVAELYSLYGNIDRIFSEAAEFDWANYNIKTRKGRWLETHRLTKGIWEVVEYGERRYYEVTLTDQGAQKKRIDLETAKKLLED